MRTRCGLFLSLRCRKPGTRNTLERCVRIGAVAFDHSLLDGSMFRTPMLVCRPVVGCKDVFVEFVGRTLHGQRWLKR